MERNLFTGLLFIGLGVFSLFNKEAWALALCLGLFLFFRKGKRSLLILSLFLFLLASFYSASLLERYEGWENLEKSQASIYILEKKGQTYIGKIISSDKKEIEGEKVLFFFRENLEISQGYLITFVGDSFERQRIPWGFDERKYYLSQKINLKIQILKLEASPQAPPFYANLLRFREKTMENYSDKYSGRAQGLVQALVFGDKSLLPQESKDSFQILGLSHLLAVSGLHGGIVAGAAYRLFAPAGFRLKNLAAWFFLLAYAFLAGFSPSINRAALMFFLFSLGKFLLRHRDIWTILAASALPQIIWNPFVLFSAGFQLSYLTLASIVYLSKKDSIFSASLAALAGSLPLLLYYFNSFSLPGLWANLFYIPLFAIITLLAMAALFLPFLPLARLADGPLNLIIEGTEEIAQIFSFMDFSCSSPAFYEVLIYYLLLGLFYKKIEIKENHKVILVSFLLLISLLPSSWQLTFVDVGQGDAALLMTEKGQAIVIDGGPWGRELENYLSSKGINRPLIYLVSHADADHVNGIIWLMERKPAKYIILPVNAQENQLTRDLFLLAEEKGSQILYGSRGQKFQIDSCLFEILLPDSKTPFKNSNDHSLVFLLSYRGKNILFTGDIEKDVLDGLKLKEKIHILKAPHHGSDTGLSPAFFAENQIENTIISCGKNNRYGHPGREFLEILEKESESIFRTDQSASIIVTFKGKDLEINGYLN